MDASLFMQFECPESQKEEESIDLEIEMCYFHFDAWLFTSSTGYEGSFVFRLLIQFPLFFKRSRLSHILQQNTTCKIKGALASRGNVIHLRNQLIHHTSSVQASAHVLSLLFCPSLSPPHSHSINV